MARLGKYSHTHLNLLLARLLARMISWIEHIFLLQIMFCLWLSIKMDNALAYNLVQSVISLFIELFFKHRTIVCYPLCWLRKNWSLKIGNPFLQILEYLPRAQKIKTEFEFQNFLGLNIYRWSFVIVFSFGTNFYLYRFGYSCRILWGIPLCFTRRCLLAFYFLG